MAASPQFKKGGAADAAGCVKGLCSLLSRGRRPFGPKVVVAAVGPLRGPGSEGSQGSQGSQGGGGGFAAV